MAKENKNKNKMTKEKVNIFLIICLFLFLIVAGLAKFVIFFIHADQTTREGTGVIILFALVFIFFIWYSCLPDE